MQRFLSILLLVLSGFSAVSPVAFAAAQPDRPACCRKDGKHHCGLQNTNTKDPSFSATCPFTQAPAQSGFRIEASVVSPGIAPSVALPESSLQPLTNQHPQTVLSRANPQRGPPAILPN